jgi:hypothetical protein
MKSGELSITWRYSENKQRTTCSVGTRNGGTLTELASATISRYYKDQFEYEKARKTSLKRVLTVIFPGSSSEAKAHRAEVWAAYFSRKAKK